MKQTHTHIARAVFVSVFASLSMAASAFQLQPMSATIAPDAQPPTTSFEVRNTTEEPIAVQMRVTTRRVQADGTELNDDASSFLEVFPSQLILRPGQQQTVRVRWTGDTAITTEIPFRVVAEQLPINLDGTGDETSGVRMMLRYRATLYVRPPGARHALTIRDLTAGPDSVDFMIENEGTAHALIPQSVMVLLADGEVTEIRAEDIEQLATINVLPGESRRVSVPIDALPVIPDEISFRFEG